MTGASDTAEWVDEVRRGREALIEGEFQRALEILVELRDRDVTNRDLERPIRMLRDERIEGVEAWFDEILAMHDGEDDTEVFEELRELSESEADFSESDLSATRDPSNEDEADSDIRDFFGDSVVDSVTSSGGEGDDVFEEPPTSESEAFAQTLPPGDSELEPISDDELEFNLEDAEGVEASSGASDDFNETPDETADLDNEPFSDEFASRDRAQEDAFDSEHERAEGDRIGPDDVRDSMAPKGGFEAEDADDREPETLSPVDEDRDEPTSAGETESSPTPTGELGAEELLGDMDLDEDDEPFAESASGPGASNRDEGDEEAFEFAFDNPDDADDPARGDASASPDEAFEGGELGDDGANEPGFSFDEFNETERTPDPAGVGGDAGDREEDGHSESGDEEVEEFDLSLDSLGEVEPSEREASSEDAESRETPTRGARFEEGGDSGAADEPRSSSSSNLGADDFDFSFDEFNETERTSSSPSAPPEEASGESFELEGLTPDAGESSPPESEDDVGSTSGLEFGGEPDEPPSRPDESDGGEEELTFGVDGGSEDELTFDFDEDSSAPSSSEGASFLEDELEQNLEGEQSEEMAGAASPSAEAEGPASLDLNLEEGGPSGSVPSGGGDSSPLDSDSSELEGATDRRGTEARDESDKARYRASPTPDDARDEDEPPRDTSETPEPSTVDDSVDDEFFDLADSISEESSGSPPDGGSEQYENDPLVEIEETSRAESSPTPHVPDFDDQDPKESSESPVPDPNVQTSNAALYPDESESSEAEESDVSLQSGAHRLLHEAEQLRESENYESARDLVQSVLERNPESDEAEELLEAIEREQSSSLIDTLGSLDAVPTQNVHMNELDLSSSELDHRCGYILSQIDGRVTFEDLLELSSMSRRETLELLVEMLEADLIDIA